MYDPDRLAAALTRSARRDARTVIEQVVAEIEGFARGAEPADDQTLLAIAIDDTAVDPSTSVIRQRSG